MIVAEAEAINNKRRTKSFRQSNAAVPGSTHDLRGRLLLLGLQAASGNQQRRKKGGNREHTARAHGLFKDGIFEVHCIDVFDGIDQSSGINARLLFEFIGITSWLAPAS